MVRPYAPIGGAHTSLKTPRTVVQRMSGSSWNLDGDPHGFTVTRVGRQQRAHVTHHLGGGRGWGRPVVHVDPGTTRRSAGSTAAARTPTVAPTTRPTRRAPPHPSTRSAPAMRRHPPVPSGLDRLLHHATALFTAMNNAIYGVSHSPNVSETCSPQSPALDALCQARFPSWGSRMRRRNAPRYQRARSRKRRGCSR